jgi:hypothetical protein
LGVRALAFVLSAALVALLIRGLSWRELLVAGVVFVVLRLLCRLRGGA